MHRLTERRGLVWSITPRALRRRDSVSHKPVSIGREVSTSPDRFQVQTRAWVCWEEENNLCLRVTTRGWWESLMSAWDQEAQNAHNQYTLDFWVTRERWANSVFGTERVILPKSSWGDVACLVLGVLVNNL